LADLQAQDIPKEYTCDGPQDVSPPLEWSGAPAGTKSFALIVDDPNAPDPKAPKTTWVPAIRFLPGGRNTQAIRATTGYGCLNTPGQGRSSLK
jgi:hypothetical protein